MLTQSATQPSVSTEALIAVIIDAIQDIKGHDIKCIDLRKIGEAPADYFIICHGTSNTQVSSIGDNVAKKVREQTGLHPIHMEGTRNARWVLVDYFNVVVHVFHEEARDFYRLEELWNDGIVKNF